MVKSFPETCQPKPLGGYNSICFNNKNNLYNHLKAYKINIYFIPAQEKKDMLYKPYKYLLYEILHMENEHLQY